MDCLKDYIGILGCGTEVPPSGLYVNELPGVTLESIDKTTGPDQVTYLGVWADAQKRAGLKLVNAVNSYFRQRYILKTIRETLNTGFLLTDVTVAKAAEYRGVEVQIANLSALQSIFVSSLNIFLQLDVPNLLVKVFDLNDGTELFAATINGTKGWNKVAVGQDFKAYHIFAGYDATNVDGLEIELAESVDNWCECTCDTFGCEAVVRGAILDEAIPAITSTSGNVASMQAVISIRCTYDSFICEHRDIFKTAYWYLLGAELMFERIYSSRLNRFTTVDLPKAEKLRTEFVETAMAEMDTALVGVCINTNDTCIECNQQYRYMEGTP